MRTTALVFAPVRLGFSIQAAIVIPFTAREP